MLILKNSLVPGKEKDKDGYYRYSFSLGGNRTINISNNLIDNNWVKPYLHRRLTQYYSVCYSDLWLYKPTYEEAIIAEKQLGIIQQ